MMIYGHDGAGWMWGFGGLMMLGVLVLIALAVWAVVTTISNRVPSSAEANGREQARQVLDQRYARGEIDTNDYTERLHTLGL